MIRGLALHLTDRSDEVVEGQDLRAGECVDGWNGVMTRGDLEDRRCPGLFSR